MKIRKKTICNSGLFVIVDSFWATNKSTITRVDCSINLWFYTGLLYYRLGEVGLNLKCNGSQVRNQSNFEILGLRANCPQCFPDGHLFKKYLGPTLLIEIYVSSKNLCFSNEADHLSSHVADRLNTHWN